MRIVMQPEATVFVNALAPVPFRTHASTSELAHEDER